MMNRMMELAKGLNVNVEYLEGEYLTENTLVIDDKEVDVLWYMDENLEGFVTDDGVVYVGDDYERVLALNGLSEVYDCIIKDKEVVDLLFDNFILVEQYKLAQKYLFNVVPMVYFNDDTLKRITDDNDIINMYKSEMEQVHKKVSDEFKFNPKRVYDENGEFVYTTMWLGVDDYEGYPFLNQYTETMDMMENIRNSVFESRHIIEKDGLYAVQQMNEDIEFYLKNFEEVKEMTEIMIKYNTDEEKIFRRYVQEEMYK